MLRKNHSLNKWLQLLTCLSGPDPAEVQRAKELCEDLLGNVKEQYQRHKDNPPQRGYGGGGGGGGGGYGERQGSASHGNGQGYGGGYGGGYGSGYGGYGNSASPTTVQSPTNPPGVGAAGTASSATDYTAQWQQYFAQNPQAYYYYQQQQAAQQQPQIPGAPIDPTPPPPPPGGAAPGASSYNSVPPPPGL